MAEDRSSIDVNTRERERLGAFIERVDDEALSAPANEYWTIAGVLGHLAYWESRVLVFAEIDRGEPWGPSDEEPEGDWLTDSTHPIIHAIEPRHAAQLALEIAEDVDRRVAELPLDRMAPWTPRARSGRRAATIEASISTSSSPLCRRGADAGRGTEQRSGSLVCEPRARSRPSTRVAGQYHARLVGEDHGLHPIAHPQFGEHVRHVCLDRRLADEKFCGDLRFDRPRAIIRRTSSSRP